MEANPHERVGHPELEAEENREEEEEEEEEEPPIEGREEDEGGEEDEEEQKNKPRLNAKQCTLCFILAIKEDSVVSEKSDLEDSEHENSSEDEGKLGASDSDLSILGGRHSVRNDDNDPSNTQCLMRVLDPLLYETSTVYHKRQVHPELEEWSSDDGDDDTDSFLRCDEDDDYYSQYGRRRQRVRPIEEFNRKKVLNTFVERLNETVKAHLLPAKRKNGSTNNLLQVYLVHEHNEDREMCRLKLLLKFKHKLKCLKPANADFCKGTFFSEVRPQSQLRTFFCTTAEDPDYTPAKVSKWKITAEREWISWARNKVNPNWHSKKPSISLDHVISNSHTSGDFLSNYQAAGLPMQNYKKGYENWEFQHKHKLESDNSYAAFVNQLKIKKKEAMLLDHFKKGTVQFPSHLSERRQRFEELFEKYTYYLSKIGSRNQDEDTLIWLSNLSEKYPDKSASELLQMVEKNMEYFAHRIEVIKKAQDWVEYCLKPDPNNLIRDRNTPLVIHGPRGRGKTRFALSIVDATTPDTPWALLVKQGFTKECMNGKEKTAILNIFDDVPFNRNDHKFRNMWKNIFSCQAVQGRDAYFNELIPANPTIILINDLELYNYWTEHEDFKNEAVYISTNMYWGPDGTDRRDQEGWGEADQTVDPSNMPYLEQLKEIESDRKKHIELQKVEKKIDYLKRNRELELELERLREDPQLQKKRILESENDMSMIKTALPYLMQGVNTLMMQTQQAQRYQLLQPQQQQQQQFLPNPFTVPAQQQHHQSLFAGQNQSFHQPVNSIPQYQLPNQYAINIPVQQSSSFSQQNAFLGQVVNSSPFTSGFQPVSSMGVVQNQDKIAPEQQATGSGPGS